MLKTYYESSYERKLKEQCTVMFEQITSGVYHVIEDRMGYYEEFATSEEVVDALNDYRMREEKVAITGKSGMYSNFELK